MRKYRNKHLTKSKLNILCRSKVKTRCGHLSVMDYLGRAFQDLTGLSLSLQNRLIPTSRK